MATSTAALLVRPSSDRTIERAGVCADGDGCPRYHCRACGHYWLGDEAAHACGSAAPDLEQRIYAWMAIELEEGEDLATCTRHVLERVKAAGLGETLLDRYGPHLIDELWRDHDDHVVERDHGNANGVAKTSTVTPQASSFGATHSGRLSAQMVARNARIQVATTADNAVAVRRERQTVTPGPRRVNVEQLATENALLECLVQVGGEWIRLGDLDKRQCKALQLEYLVVADQYRRRTIAFGRLVAGLAEGQTVRERWTAEQLATLVGDNLSGAAPARPTW